MSRFAPYYPNFRVELTVIDSSLQAWLLSSSTEWRRSIDHVNDACAQMGAGSWTNGSTLTILCRLEAVSP